MPTASAEMCAGRRKSIKFLRPPVKVGFRSALHELSNSSISSRLYPVAKATSGCAHDCSKPRTVCPRIFRIEMAIANRRSPPKRIESFHWLAIITNPFRLSEYHGVPTRFQLNFLLLHLAIPVSPVDLNWELHFERYGAEPEMYVGASLPRMTVAAVNLSNQPPAIRQANFHNCT